MTSQCLGRCQRSVAAKLTNHDRLFRTPLGQWRWFRNVGDESAYPPIAALKRTWPHVAFVRILLQKSPKRETGRAWRRARALSCHSLR
jgi:NADPH-dependent ferric siderophore reductase